MIAIQRLTLDSSWYIQFNNLRIIVDPWLVGSEIDGFSWLNEQWHVKEPIPPDAVPACDAILISQSYEDHCHLNTLKVMDEKIPLLATAKAYKRLKKYFPNRTVYLIPEHGPKGGKETIKAGQGLDFKGCTFMAIRPDKLIDPVYFAVVISNWEREAIFYTPHGFSLKENQVKALEIFDFKLLFTTFTRFQLPALLGGLVNPGMENVRELYGFLKPDYVVNTHDEEKLMKGIVAKMGKVEYADYEVVKRDKGLRFLEVKGYEEVVV